MTDLDDFFAKKDRKKAKGTKKFTTTDEIAKKLEENEKRNERQKLREKATTNPEVVNTDVQQPDADDEWKEFEEETKDYSGLKIVNSTPNHYSDDETDEERGTGENSSDGENGDASSKQTGPWKKNPELSETSEPPQQPATSNATTTSSTTNMVYKTPHLRNQTAQQNSSRSRMKNVAPDIRSEEYFPTLNAKQQTQGLESTGIWGRRKKDEGNFEEVRNRGSNRYTVQDTQSQAPKLSLDNKYGALSQDQS